MGDGKARVLIVGTGARNHALGEALRRSPSVGKVVFAPGTSGLERLGFETAPVASQDFDGLVELAMMEEFDLTIVGPNSPLVYGLVDAFEAEGLPIFGPTKAAARLEGSKSFARMLMNQLRIRTPRFAVCDSAERALHHARRHGWARVFKVDGLGYGKGVRVTETLREAEAALGTILEDNVYGRDLNDRIVVEQRLDGQEVTVFALTDGEAIEVLGYVRNHPRLYDGEQGPPTRALGQVTEPPEVDEAMRERVMATILRPTIDAMAARGTPMRGALFVDMMLVSGHPVVLDYNVRFGDPATQTLLTTYRGDWYRALQACRGEGSLSEAVGALERDPRPHVSLVLVAEGYPDRRVRGDAITFVEPERLMHDPDLRVYEDGVLWRPARDDQPERLETTGGRIFTLVAAGETVAEARARVYAAAEAVRFRGMHYRTDIGA